MKTGVLDITAKAFYGGVLLLLRALKLGVVTAFSVLGFVRAKALYSVMTLITPALKLGLNRTLCELGFSPLYLQH